MSPPLKSAFRDGEHLPDDRSFRRLLWRATITLLVSLLLPFVVLLGLVEVLLQSAHWVDHSDQVLSEANYVEKLLETTQSAFRGYRLSRDADNFDHYRAARDELPLHLRTLAELMADNSAQLAGVRQLTAQKDVWVKITDEVMARVATGQSEADILVYMRSMRGGFQTAVDQAHALIAEEQQLRTERARRLQSLITIIKLAFAATALGSMLTLSWWLRRFLRRVSASYEASIGAAERAQAAAEQANRAKDDFLAALSHELRTPLTPVLMAASSLGEDERLPVDVREQLAMMERNIALEARLIDDLLDLTAISRGKLQLRLQPCDAHVLIGLAVEIVRGDAGAKRVALEEALTASDFTLVADPARFQQVIWNLLRNAVKFTPPGGRVTIRTANFAESGGAPWLRLEVIDSGIGIDPALLDQIFQPFDQGGLTGDHRFGGIGLGLTIARTVVELHGGRIRAASEGINRGASFVVELPSTVEAAAQPEGSAMSRATAAPAAAEGPRKLRLLLVEDHPSTLQALARLLRREGHHVTPASSLADALAMSATAIFDLVISDLGLPDGTGLELMSRLRDAYGLRGIALSGYGTKEDIASSEASGFIAHLVKPVPFGEIRRVLAAHSAP